MDEWRWWWSRSAAINWSVSRSGQRCDYFHDVSIQIKCIVKRCLIVRPLQFAAVFYQPRCPLNATANMQHAWLQTIPMTSRKRPWDSPCRSRAGPLFSNLGLIRRFHSLLFFHPNFCFAWHALDISISNNVWRMLKIRACKASFYWNCYSFTTRRIISVDVMESLKRLDLEKLNLDSIEELWRKTVFVTYIITLAATVKSISQVVFLKLKRKFLVMKRYNSWKNLERG